MIKSILGPRVLIECLAEKKETDGGIYMPDSVESTESTRTAKVILVGNDVKNVKSDQTILIPKIGAQLPIKQGSKDCLLILESDVLAILED